VENHISIYNTTNIVKRPQRLAVAKSHCVSL
ncbi:uncharacterized protein METZ01_LOCUS261868, partial [marine metagenome]